MSRPQSATRPAPAYAGSGTSRVSKMAVWSLVLSIITLGGIGSLAGIILGVAARRRIDASGKAGRSLALAGIIVGVFTLFIALAYWAWLGMHFGTPGGGSGGGGGGGGGGY
jgi:Domain of unknown function (DUF4190)